MRPNRKQKASGTYRLEPLFDDQEKKTLMLGETTHIIEGKLSDFLIVSLPETTTQAAAMDIERELSKVAKQDVLSISHNMTLLKATLMTGREKKAFAAAVEGQKTSGDGEMVTQLGGNAAESDDDADLAQ